MCIAINNDIIAEREFAITVFNGVIDCGIKYPGGWEHTLPAINQTGRKYFLLSPGAFNNEKNRN